MSEKEKEQEKNHEEEQDSDEQGEPPPKKTAPVRAPKDRGKIFGKFKYWSKGYRTTKKGKRTKYF